MAPSAQSVVDMGDVLTHGGGSALAGERYVTSRNIGADLDMSSEVIGSGMSGNVLLARRSNGGAKCAVKSFSKDTLSPQCMSDLKSEAEIYLTLDHPRIARLEAVYETKARLHLVMEHLAGGDLMDRFQEQRQFSEHSAAGMMRQILQTVVYLHSRGIVHRDLKLENFVCETKRSEDIKLIDFGFTCRWSSHEPLQRPCGTPGYAALEVYKKRYTSKVDVWSAGIISYVLLTGRFPLPDDALAARKALKEGAPWNSKFTSLSAEAQEFVRLLLGTSPDQRPNAAEALQHVWLKVGEEKRVPIDHTVLAGLRRFAAASITQRMVVALEAWHAPSSLTADARVQYLALCGDEPVLTRERFVQRLTSEFNVDGLEAVRIFDALDCQSGHVSYTWFLAGVLPSASLPDLQQFTMFDAQSRRRCLSEDVRGPGWSSRRRALTHCGSPSSRGSDKFRYRRSATTGVAALGDSGSHADQQKRSATTGAETTVAESFIEKRSDQNLSSALATLCRILRVACPSRNRSSKVRTPHACVTAARSRICSAADTSPSLSSRVRS
eukprot:CAMPEP_0194550608 /NCGR_PEP_ID=MMETSP0253-20130528/95796_1 /TAXON_ID=2966 /ORGANISM="Noctiluca scintillans" /LENGTH=551 /DNA_ID=CAMNT_0039398047 /DNA_START=14 /DNA_END=1669 /DNA_ORIENTATION=+